MRIGMLLCLSLAIAACQTSNSMMNDAQGSDGGSGVLLPACTTSCTASSDCVKPGSNALFDADNFDCISGACQWKGCNNAAECMSGQSPAYTICK